MSDVLVKSWVDGCVSHVSLNRPEKHNAKNLALIDALHRAVQEADADPSTRVIVISGEGPSFSSGHDVKEVDFSPEVAALYANPEIRLATEREHYFEKSLAIRNTRKPTIAQVHGHCLAAGLMTVAMCDIVVAAEDAVFGMPVLSRSAAAGEILFEPWEIGARRARELLFTGDSIDATTAERWGFVNRVVPRDRLESEVKQIAEKICQQPQQAVELTKISINRTLDAMGQKTAWEDHFIRHVFSHFTDEAREHRRIRQGDK